MADTSEEVALRLHKFFEAAEHKEKTSAVQRDYAPSMRPAAGKPRILEIYEQYLRRLTVEERNELDGIVKKMSGTV
jgi:hypothetical protein